MNNKQQGIAQLLLLLLAAVGIIAFLLFSSSADFKSKLFSTSTIFPNKPKSHATETATTIGINSGLVGYWKFDEGGGTSVGSSGSNNAGTWNGTFTPGSQWTTGKFRSAGNYTGANTVVVNNPSVALTGSFTISAWVKRGTTASYSYGILSKGNISAGATTGNYGNSFGLYLGKTGQFVLKVANGTNFAYVNSNQTITDTATWHHVVGVYTGGTNVTPKLELYVDGNPPATRVTNVPPSLYSNQANVTIGSITGSSGAYNWFWNGQLDDVRLYNKALSAGDVGQLFNYTPPPSPSVSLDTQPPLYNGQQNVNISWSGVTNPTADHDYIWLTQIDATNTYNRQCFFTSSCSSCRTGILGTVAKDSGVCQQITIGPPSSPFNFDSIPAGTYRLDFYSNNILVASSDTFSIVAPAPSPSASPSASPTSTLPIVFDAASSSSGAYTLTWSHTTSSASDRIMIVGASIRGNVPISSITYAGQPLTKIRFDTYGSDVRSELWYLKNPPSGANNVVLTLSSSQNVVAGATTWSNVNQTTPLGSNAGANHNGTAGTSASVTISSDTNQVVVDVAATQNTGATLTVNNSQTQRWNTVGPHGVGAASSKVGGIASTTMSWTLAYPEYWAISAVSLIPK